MHLVNDGCGVERDVEISEDEFVEHLIQRFDVKSTLNTLGSPGNDLGPKRDDEQGGDCPVREATGSLI